MKSPIFFPPPRYVPALPDLGPAAAEAMPIRELCAAAGVVCKASGAWVLRPIQVIPDAADSGQAGLVVSEPGGGAAQVHVPSGLDDRDAARYALLVLAYSGMDLVARASVAGQPWARPMGRPGRPRKPGAKTNAQRQREFRARRASRVA